MGPRTTRCLAIVIASSLAHCGGPTSTDAAADAAAGDTRPGDVVPNDVPGTNDVPMGADVPTTTDVPMTTDVPTSMDVPVVTDVAMGADVPRVDVPVAPDVPTSMDVLVTPDIPVIRDAPITTDVPVTGCGTARPAIDAIRGTEGLVIGRDGTIYYSQRAAVGRMRPGMTPENNWVPLAGATTVWGMVLDAANTRMYVGSPTTRILYSIDLTTTPPTISNHVTMAGSPNGLTIDAAGNVYYSDFAGGNVYRVTAAAVRTQVNTAAFNSPNGLAFQAPNVLLVLNYATGVINRLTLDAVGRETGRTLFGRVTGAPDGIALDTSGRVYIGNNSVGSLVRLEADGTMPMTLLTAVGAAANVEFGAGVLNCNDIYVASSGVLARYTMGTTRGATVPWH